MVYVRASSGIAVRISCVVTPSEVIWPRARHTEAKHRLLVNYLDAWIGILGSWADHVLLVDDFAGPGGYSDGEHGSPVLMLDAYLRRRDRAQLKPVFSTPAAATASSACRLPARSPFAKSPWTPT